MRVRNTSNQGVILRKIDRGSITDTVRLQPGDNDVHEMWRPEAEAHPLIETRPQGNYEGPSRRGMVEPVYPHPGDPASAVKHDDQPHGGHPGRPAGPDDETARVTPPGGEPDDEKPKADEDDDEAKRKADDKGPGRRRRDG